MFRLRFLPVFFFPLIFLATGASGEECHPKDDVLAGNSKLPVVRKYVCGAPPKAIEVTFLRLNEAIIGSLLRSENIPGLDFLWKDTAVAQTEPAIKSRALFDKFGRTSTFAAEDAELAVIPEQGQAKAQNFTLSALTSQAFPPGSAADPTDVSGPPEQTITTLSAPFSELSQQQRGYSIFLSDFDHAYNKERRWPKGWKFFYECESDAIQCTSLWRYLKLEELTSVDKATKKFFELLNNDSEERKAYRARYEGNAWDEDITFKTHLRLCAHLGKQSLPKNFLVVVGHQDYSCEVRTNSKYYLPRLSVTVALIRNESSHSARVDSNISFQSKKTGLRQAEIQEEKVPLSDNNRFVISPGETMIVPIAIGFKTSLPSFDKEVSESMYQRISSKPQSAIFKFKGEWGNVKWKIEKARKSFLPPEYPSDVDFSYGPSIYLGGLESGGTSFSLPRYFQVGLVLPKIQDKSGAESNAVDPDIPPTELALTTTFNPEQSCPYLSYWNSIRHAWVTKGKVLDKAKGEKNETAEAIIVPRHAYRFRLTEEEPEVAYIRSVKLKIKLNNDADVELTPTNIERAYQGAILYRIAPYTGVEFSFDVPDQYRHDIREQRIEIRGYYRRLSEIVTSAN